MKSTERQHEPAARFARTGWAARIGSAGVVAALTGAALSGLGGCQAPCGATPFAYGSAAACAELAAEPDRPISLQASLDPLREAFDAHADVPRLVVLMPHMGCERGAEILRREVLGAHPGEDLALFVIWQDEARTGGADAAARASGYLKDPRVTAFHDCSGIAGRAFATGNLPVAEAREVFLFYPAGLTWPSEGGRPMNARPVAAQRPPKTENWVHQLGRVAPERYCTPEELPRAIRETVARLLEDAEARREALRQEAHVQTANQDGSAGLLQTGAWASDRRASTRRL
ncbi:hypothetical protein Poly30_12040 [Planctomycetes bacterium Poly30]|uniref:Uncharacterized protein n=1 Tax=Saltatorellus ferox TaxID=2528018 RepID=A0A518ENP8_9BACT|nr:hypothetical protein Poly30_12040 [Planctomycetes bacterium Poly30]